MPPPCCKAKDRGNPNDLALVPGQGYPRTFSVAGISMERSFHASGSSTSRVSGSGRNAHICGSQRQDEQILGRSSDWQRLRRALSTSIRYHGFPAQGSCACEARKDPPVDGVVSGESVDTDQRRVASPVADWFLVGCECPRRIASVERLCPRRVGNCRALVGLGGEPARPVEGASAHFRSRGPRGGMF